MLGSARIAGSDRPAMAMPATTGFERMLDGLRQADPPDRDMHRLAEQLVGQALYLPLLKQARNNAFKSDLFHGGQGEEAFGSQLDMELADRLAKRNGQGLVDAIAAKFTRGGTVHVNG